MRNGKVFTRHDYERLLKMIQSGEVAADAGCVATLKRDLARSRPIDSREVRSNIVTMNSKFSLMNLGNGKKEIYSLVFPKDSSGSNKINVFSGLGMQVIGSPIGTVIKSNPPSEQYYVIADLVYQPEAAGDYHL